MQTSTPAYLFETPKIDSNRTLESDADLALFMLDIYTAYEKCVINLNTLKRLEQIRSKDE